VKQSSGRPNILIIGTDFRNQGAYLMMVAAIHEITRRFAGTPVLGARVGNPMQRRRVGALTMLPVSSRMPHIEATKTLMAKAGAVDHRDVDVVFDASGFFYSDSWKQFVGGRASLLQKFGDIGTPVYFLPQAFGPFEFTSVASFSAAKPFGLVYSSRLFISSPPNIRHAASKALCSKNRICLARMPEGAGRLRTNPHTIARRGI